MMTENEIRISYPRSIFFIHLMHELKPLVLLVSKKSMIPYGSIAGRTFLHLAFMQ